MELVEQVPRPMVLIQQYPCIEKILQNRCSDGALVLDDDVHNPLNRLEPVATRKNEVKNIKIGVIDRPGSTFPAVKYLDAVAAAP